jgi:uncharacterized repeat protein (TIGR01451 family)
VSSDTPDPDGANNSSTVTGSISTSADLSVSKTGPSSVTAGTTATYTISLSNAGPSDAQNVNLSDTLPTGAALISLTPDGNNPDLFTVTGTSATATTVANGNTDTFVLVVSAPSNLASGADFSDTASVTSNTPDSNQGDNSSTVTGSIATSADLSISKTGPARVTAGTTATYTITLSNSGPSDAQNVNLSDTLPTGAVLVSLTPDPGNPDVFVVTGTTATANTVGNGNTDTFVLVVSAPSNLSSGADFSDTASVTSDTSDPNTSNNTSKVTSSISTSADLSISKSGPATVTAGTTATYTITVSNSGPSDAQNVSVSDTLPTGAVLVALTPDINNPDVFAVTGTTAMATTVGNGNTDTFVLVVTAPSNLASGADFSDSATVNSDTSDPDTDNNFSSVTGSITTSADLSISKTGPAFIVAGSNATYTITVANNGPSDALNVNLTDTLPTGGVLVSLTPGGNNPDLFTTSGATAAAASVGAGNTDTFVLVVSAPNTLLDGADFSDTASVSSPTNNNTANNSSTVHTTISAPADLSVSKTGPATVMAGTTATYTITVTNSGPANAHDVALSDTLPTGAVLVSLTADGNNPDLFTVTGSTASATTMGNGNTDTFVLVVSAPSNLASGADFSDTASVTSATPDTNPGNNSSTVTGSIKTSADLSLSKSGPAIVPAGTAATYTITLTNNGPSDAQNVKIDDTLPAGAVLLSLTPEANNPDAFMVSGATASAATVGNGNTDTFVLVVSAPSNLASGTDFSDTAAVTSDTPDPTPGNDTSTVTGSVRNSADLSISKTGPATVTAGTTATYTITLSNNGPSDAQNVNLSDTLPTGAVLVSLTPNDGNPDTFAVNGTTASAATVGNGNSDTFVLVVRAPSSLVSGADFSDTASVSSNTSDPTPGNNSSTVTGGLVTSADLALTKSGPSQVTAGADVTYKITLTNNGPSDARNVNISDVIPAGATIVSLTPNRSNPDTFTVAGGTATATSVGSGHMDTFVLVLQASRNLAPGDDFSDTASVTSDTPDPTPGNESSSVSGKITTPADLAVTKTGPATVTAGTTATYTISLTNKGPSAAQNVSLSDMLPAGAVLVSLTPVGTNPDPFTVTGTTANAATVASGNTDSFVLEVSVPSNLASGAGFSDTASVTSDTPDPTPGNDSSTVNGTVATTADLSVSINGPPTVVPGSNVTYTITLTNNGPSDAQSVNVTDTLPPGAVLVSLTPGANNPDLFTVTGPTATAATVANGNTDTFVLVATVPGNLTAGSTFTNSVSVTSPTADPVIANNNSAQAAAVIGGALTLTGVKQIETTEHATLTGVTLATFTFPGGGPASSFSATIDWGDGSSSAGTIVPSGAGFAIVGTHRFHDEQTLMVTVTVTNGSTTATAKVLGLVDEAPLPPGVPNTPQTNLIDETMDHLFDGQVTTQQMNALNFLMSAMEFIGASAMMNNGVAIFPAFNFSEAVVQGEFGALSQILSQRGVSLNNAALDMELFFLFQGLLILSTNAA